MLPDDITNSVGSNSVLCEIVERCQAFRFFYGIVAGVSFEKNAIESRKCSMKNSFTKKSYLMKERNLFTLTGKIFLLIYF